jgi:hypothetical protein
MASTKFIAMVKRRSKENYGVKTMRINKCKYFSTILAFLLTLPCIAVAQETAPAHDVENQSKETQTSGEKKEGQRKTYELPEIVVKQRKALREEQLIGPYKQPRWTASRRFPTTRVYVIPEGKFEFEWWTERNVPRDGNAETTYLYEFGMGLPHRLQLDIYQGFSKTDNTYKASQQSIELRWAMADWGELWGNPTWYYEYTIQDGGPDKQEIKLLLGDEFAPRWHWGLNLVREWTLTDIENREEENGVAAGISYTVKDDELSVGLEVKAARETTLLSGGGRKWLTTFKMGPSILWKLSARGQLEFVPLIGFGPDSEKSQSWLVISWEL